MSRYARRTDTNHSEIVNLLRSIGAQVLDLHALPGALDVLVGFRGVLHLFEVKHGKGWKLTEAEGITIERFRSIGCPVHIVETEDDVLRALRILPRPRGGNG
jgi:hypothetical protein